MRVVKTFAVVAAFIFAVVSLAEEHARTEIRIAVDDESGGPHGIYSWTDEDMDFDLHAMQEGESRSFVDSEGRSVVVTRKADGMKFEVDGKTLEMPIFEGEYAHGMIASPVSGDVDFDVHVAAAPGHMSVSGPDGITILSREPLDDSVKESIKSVLVSAGHDDEVRFIDHNSVMSGTMVMPDGDHRIKVIRKEVEVSH